MIILSEVEFDKLISKFDKLKSTKEITKKIAQYYYQKNNNGFVSNFNFQKNFLEYKNNFFNFLKLQNVNLGFNEKKLLEHYNQSFRYKNKTYIKKTKIYWM
ncbi:hypothetical protein IKS57_04030 [bacterium]|nr:hypothetical protein [bacterium]